MRQQYCGALGHLMRHCQTQIRLTPMLASNSSCFPRRLTFRSSSNSNSYHYHNNNNNNHSNVRHKAAAVSDGRNYSKFSSHLNSERAMELLCNLDEDERHNLRDAMFKMESDKVKKLYESQLAVGSWRTRFGRLSNKTPLGAVDPSGTFCAMPDDWLKKKLVEAAEPPTAAQLYSIFFVNAVPFIAFGFLDNFIMIMAGEYIESYLGHFITLSTMAAAGLGNTISDIIGITTASYVESTCHLLGLKQPRMTPQQFELQSSRRASSWGRIIGITIGCLLGQLAVGSWRTRFGRLSNKTPLGAVDPSGTFCAMPDDWLKKKLVEAAEPPTAAQLYSIFFVNAVPFIAFGFLDNFIMIMAGEYIESYLGHFITLSTMAAAGLGNTISDIIGITTASYVESTCHLLGLKQPRMTPQQFELQSSRRASSWGRIIGITIGCLLGMCPLWFITPEEKECPKE